MKKPTIADKKKVEFNTDLNETFEFEKHEYDPEPEPVSKKVPKKRAQSARAKKEKI